MQNPEEKGLLGASWGEVSCLLISAHVWAIAYSVQIPERGCGWRSGASRTPRCDWAQFQPQRTQQETAATSSGASGLRKTLVPCSFCRALFLASPWSRGSAGLTVTRCWAEVSQLSLSPKASAFRQMKVWKVLWLNTRKTAYITQPEETGRKSPCSWLRRSQPILREGSLGAWGWGVLAQRAWLLKVRGKWGHSRDQEVPVTCVIGWAAPAGHRAPVCRVLRMSQP